MFFSGENVESDAIPPIQDIGTVRLFQASTHFTIHGRVISKTKVFPFRRRDGKGNVTTIFVYIRDMSGLMRLVFFDEEAARFVFLNFEKKK